MHPSHERGFLSALLLFLFVGVAACGGAPDTPDTPEAPEAPVTDSAQISTAPEAAPADTAPDAADTAAAAADTAKVTVEDFQFTKLDNGTRVFMGVLYNPTSEAIAVAQIQIALYNASNVRVGKAEITVEDIPPGERKPFREPLGSGKQNIQAADVRSVLVM